jgi:hypothetical protein
MIGVCQFCKCTENAPCFIPAEFISDPEFRANGNVVPCAWLLDDVCTNPACVDAAYLEARPQAEELTQKLDMILEAA